MLFRSILYFPDMLPAGIGRWLWLNPMADWMSLIHAWVNGTSIDSHSVWRLLVLWLFLLAPAWLLYRRTLLHVRELL